MKRALILIISAIATVTAAAQTLTITFAVNNTNRTYQVVLDGTSYYSNSTNEATSTTGVNTTGVNNKNVITLPNQQLGSHTLAVYRMRNNNANNNSNVNQTGNALYSNTFQLRQGYDMDIAIKNNGQVTFTEKRVRRGNIGNRNRTPMTDVAFNQVLQNVRSRFSQSSKVSAARDAFNVSTNYFSTAQVRQVLLLVRAESARLELAKLAYGKVTDPAQFTMLYDVFPSIASRDEMNAYIRNNPNTGGYSGDYNNPNSTRIPMSDYLFLQLVQNVNSQWNQEGKVNVIRSAFSNTANYFSTAQTRQLLSAITAENNRLELAKLAYARTSDVANFTTLYDMFSVAGKNDLNNFITGGYTNTQYNTKPPMGDTDFSQLLQKANNHFLPWDKVKDVRAAFNNTANFFTTAQIRQLLALVAAEDDKLELAKLSYRSVTDAYNFLQITDMFSRQSSKDELTNFVNTNK